MTQNRKIITVKGKVGDLFPGWEKDLKKNVLKLGINTSRISLPSVLNCCRITDILLQK